MNKNRILTQDEVLLSVGIPFAKKVLTAAAELAKSDPSDVIVVPNPIRDCMPVSVRRECLTEEAMGLAFEQIDRIERDLRAKVTP